MNNNRRRNFRSRSPKNNFRRRNGSISSSVHNNLINGNKNFNRNGSFNNINSVEKAMQKFQQLAKDAQSNGDPILVESYLQHADHYLRRYNELNAKNKNENLLKSDESENSLMENSSEKKIIQSHN
jgi:hypothetical protein|tara:strand:+ start:510 stop:887 length:378 start_codon:yes stop_codon:yes gene_type:complete